MLRKKHSLPSSCEPRYLSKHHLLSIHINRVHTPLDLDCKTKMMLSPQNYCWTIGYGPSRKQAEDLCLSFPSLMVWQGEEWPSPYLFHFWVLIDGPFYKWLPQDLFSVKECTETLCAFQLTVVTYKKWEITCCICTLWLCPESKDISSLPKPSELTCYPLSTSEAAFELK